MVPPNLYIWSMSSKESLESQRKHAPKNRFFPALLCKNDNFFPDTIGECSLEGVHPFLTKVVLIMNSCFIQYNAPLVKYVSVAQ